MNTTQLATTSQTDNTILVPAKPDKDSKYRLTKYQTWLDDHGASWWAPDLGKYRDDLLASDLAASTVSAHLSTIRGRYAVLLRDRARFFAMVPDDVVIGPDFGSKKEAVDELVKRIENELHPDAARVVTEEKQDTADEEFLRLTKEQASALLAAPGVASLKALRDTAVIAVLLCTGIREQELSNLTVDDLRKTLGGELSLSVRKAKGCKSRLVPYGELSWCLAIVDKWLTRAGIAGDDEPVFRGLYKGGQKLRLGKLSVRAIEYILAEYPVMVGDVARTAKPHDCRRTYAKRLYDAGLDPVAIQQNLGHADLKTTLRYIGVLDADQRRPPSVYDFDLSGLVNGNH